MLNFCINILQDYKMFLYTNNIQCVQNVQVPCICIDEHIENIQSLFMLL